MKYSYFRLKELTKTKKTSEQLAELLTMKAFEVESIEKLGEGLDKVVVGEILEIEKHPNADKLQIAIVDVGLAVSPSLLTYLPQEGEKKSKKGLLIVCGASNIAVEQKVPVALVGAKLARGFEIKEAEIRGVKSSGMLCAEDELGLGKDHSGILILDPRAKVGAPLAQELWLEDAMLDIKVLPDRSHDALSHVGMAREISALEGRKMEFRDPISKLSGKRFNGVKIVDKKLCARYIGVVMENIRVVPSPLQYRLMLQKFANNAISNIVDVTNVVMLEQGQPMHAFDYDKLTLPVSVRVARKGEKIKLLDGNTYELSSEDIVIADAKGAIALAGVMGGFESAVSENTTKILLEAAHFDAVHIRRTRTRLGIKTDASDRFEKGISPVLAEKGMTQAVGIIQMIGGKVVALDDVYPVKAKAKNIYLALEYLKNLLGVDVPEKEIRKILENLGCKVSKKGKGFQVRPLAERLDVETQEDLIEDIGRIYGYERIRPQAPHAPVIPAKRSAFNLFEREVKGILKGSGFSETVNYSFYSRQDAEAAQLGSLQHLELENPMNPDQEWVRVSLIPGILKNISHNLKFQKNLRLFESGRAYWPDGKVPEEKKMLVGAVAVSGKEKKKGSLFFESKGVVHHLLEGLGIDDFYYDGMESIPEDTLVSFWHPGRTAAVKREGTDEEIGYVGEVNPFVLSEFEIEERVAIFEFDLEKLLVISEGELEYAPIRKFPIVERDIALVSEMNVKVDDILQTIQMAGGRLVLDADLFDIFDFADGSTSYAFHILFGADDRTLESAEVDKLMEKIAGQLEKELGVKIRR